MEDSQLVLAARSGDREAFAAIYDRYADRIHDFCTSTLRDRAEAADVMQETFLVALERLGQLRDPSRLKPWLYSIAHHAALKRIRGRSRVDSGDDMTQLPAMGSSPDEEASRSELAAFVWDAAGGLGERDRALLDLHLRQGLDGKDLADAVGVTPAHLYVMLNRLRLQVERSIGALLVARMGRKHCPELAGVLAGWDGRLTPDLRSRVVRHVDSCDNCARRRAAALSPLQLLAATPLVAAPSHLRSVVLGKAHLISASWTAPGAAPWGRPGSAPGPGAPVAATSVSAAWLLDTAGFPLAHGEGFGGDAPVSLVDADGYLPGANRRRILLGLAAALLLLILSGVAALLLGNHAMSVATAQRPIPATTPAPPASAPSPSLPELPPPPTTSPTPSTAPSALRVDTTSLDFGSDAVSRSLVLLNDGGAPASFVLSAPSHVTVSVSDGTVSPHGSTTVSVTIDRTQLAEGPLNGVVHVGGSSADVSVALLGTVERAPLLSEVSSAASSVSVSGCPTQASTSTPVTATVTDPDTLAAPALHWKAPDGTTASTPMAQDASGRWGAILGPFRIPGTVLWWITAADPTGVAAQSSSHMLAVDPCAQPPTTLPTSTSTSTPAPALQ